MFSASSIYRTYQPRSFNQSRSRSQCTC